MMELKEYTEYLLTVLRNCEISETEFDYRKKRLVDAEQRKGSQINPISDSYYNLAHEIKAAQFMQQFGNVMISQDSVSQSGCDLLLNGRYQIECVCSSAGDAQKNGLFDLCIMNNSNGKLIDYGKKQKVLYSRLTSSIAEKRNFYFKHLENGSMDSQKPYLVFLGLGPLSLEMHTGNNGVEFTGVLFGKGNPEILIDNKTGEIVGTDYSHEDVLIKWNGAELNCNIFQCQEYQCVSAILLSKADLYEPYTIHNTWLFINPFAYNKVTKKDFNGMIYWYACCGEYCSYKKWHRI